MGAAVTPGTMGAEGGTHGNTSGRGFFKRLGSRGRCMVTLLGVLAALSVTMQLVAMTAGGRRGAIVARAAASLGVAPDLSSARAYAPGQSETFYVAANLYNSEDILTHGWGDELLEFIERLGYSKVFVSIYENGSKDRTKELLAEFKAQLDGLGVANSVVLEATAKPEGMGWYKLKTNASQDLITYLSDKRNRLLDALPAADARFHFSRVLFFNDVVFDADDAWALLATNGGQYDMACAMDFYNGFYDRWVTRDVEGRLMSRWYPYARHADSQALLRAGLPFPVSTCWNGIAMMDAKPFTVHGVTFHASEPDQCYSSECLWVGHDIRALGYTRILMNPAVILAYERRFYWLQRYITPLVFGIREAVGLVNTEPGVKDEMEAPGSYAHVETAVPLPGHEGRRIELECSHLPMDCC